MAKAAERIGRRAPLSLRTTDELRERLEKAASAAGRSLTSELERRFEQSFIVENVFGDLKTLQERLANGLEIEMRRQGWKPVVGTPYWAKPGSMPGPESGFIDPEKDAAPFLHRVEPAAVPSNDLEVTTKRAVVAALRETLPASLTNRPSPDKQNEG